MAILLTETVSPPLPAFTQGPHFVETKSVLALAVKAGRNTGSSDLWAPVGSTTPVRPDTQ